MNNYNLTYEYDKKNKFISDFQKAFDKIKNQRSYKDIVFLCVGTDRIIGDCFGPLVGTKLTKLLVNENYSNINVYGNLDNTLNYSNIDKVLKNHVNDKTFTIIIDSAFSKKENIGQIFVSNNKTILGKGLNKNKIEVGDISIKSVVAKDYKLPNYNFKALQNISLGMVMNLSEIVSEGIYEIVKKY